MSAFDLLLGSKSQTPTIYTQSAVLTASQRVGIPAGCKRIEALLVGAGGGGGAGGGACGGGGLGGIGIFEIPITGIYLDLVVGAGVSHGPGSPTYILAASGTQLARIGGGGTGGALSYAGIDGTEGGHGGGSGSQQKRGGHGGGRPVGNLLWWPPASLHAYDIDDRFATTAASFLNAWSLPPANGGQGGRPVYDGASWHSLYPSRGSYGGGNGGACNATGVAGFGSGGSGFDGATTAAGGGGGAGGSATGGTLVGLTVWGFTGYAGAASPAAGVGGGGGGLFGAASLSDGGLGGGGGGGNGSGAYGSGKGGDGAAVFRFYF